MTDKPKIIKFLNAILIISSLTAVMFAITNVFAEMVHCEWRKCEPSSSGDGSEGGESDGGGGGNSCAGGGGGLYGPMTNPYDRTCVLKKKTYKCEINEEEIEESVSLVEDVYDTKNNYLGEALLVKDQYRFLAGRFIGIDAYEKYSITYNVSVTASCNIGAMVCQWTCGTMDCWDENGNQYECPVCSCTLYKVCLPCEVETSYCRPQAEEKLEELVQAVDTDPSFIAKRQDVNDINKGLSGTEPTIDVALSHTSVYIGEPEPSDPNSTMVSRTVTYEYRYNLTPAWINPQTGQVKYEQVKEDAITEKEKQNYIKVPEMYITKAGEKIRIGQYFVPLNAKSTDVLPYYLNPDMTKTPLSKKLCEAMITKYDEEISGMEHWKYIIADINGAPLKNRANTTAEAVNIVNSEDGCRLSLRIDYRIAQGFYNEETKKKNNNNNNNIGGGGGAGLNGADQVAIRGYNFYYRPIDYGAPFPNGLSDNSYWIEAYDGKNNAVTIENASGNKLDLDDSFKAVTYATNSNYNLSAIRDYNKKEDNKYTSMAKISISGTSSFISDGYGVTRYACQTYYALGCGPANSDWEQCQVRKTGVCKR